jgi:predicted CXXCH cytochrome family protein
MSTGGRVSMVILASTAVMALAAAGARATRRAAHDAAQTARSEVLPRRGTPETYATSDGCRACHPAAYASWHRSHHRTMTQVATSPAIVGAFDGRWLGEHRVGRDGDRSWVEMPTIDGGRERRTVALVTGSHHMQVYWVPAPSGDRLVAFPWAWLIEEQSWVPNEATLLRPPGTDVEYTWNRVCIKCHVVAGNPGWDEARERVQSSVAELGIACEACHGPGRSHAERHRDPLQRYARHLSDQPVDDIVHPDRMSAQASSELCGQCHSITVFLDDEAWVRSGHEHPPPSSLSSWGRLVRHPLRADQPWIDTVLEGDPDFFAERFWPDGMVRISGREYNGLVESACHQRGDLGCTTCHSMHDAPPDDQLRDDATGDGVCATCHARVAADVVAHTRHPSGRSQPTCYDCHMPHTTYGLLGAIRSHEIDSPRLQLTLDTGRPNACNLCHLDQTLAWTAEHLHAWYGQPRPDLPPEDPAESAALRWLLAGDAGQRALLAWHFGWGPALAVSGSQWQSRSLQLLADDPYPAVRIVAARALRRLSAHERPGNASATRPTPWWNPAAARALRQRRDDRPVWLAE